MLDNTDIDSAIPILQSREYRHFAVNPRTPVIGGVIEGGDFENMDDQFLDDLRDALWTYGVLFGKRRHLSFETMKNVARAFGDQFEHHSFANTLEDEGFPESPRLRACWQRSDVRIDPQKHARRFSSFQRKDADACQIARHKSTARRAGHRETDHPYSRSHRPR